MGLSVESRTEVSNQFDSSHYRGYCYRERDTFNQPNSHMWLAASMLDTTGLEDTIRDALLKIVDLSLQR